MAESKCLPVSGQVASCTFLIPEDTYNTFFMPATHGGAREGSGRKKKDDENASISMRLNKEALDICRKYYKEKFSRKINDYVIKLAKKLVRNT